MPEQVRVVDGDAPERAVPPGPRSAWGLFVLGFVVGVGATIVVVTPAASTAPSATTLPGEIDFPLPSATEEREVPGIGELVDGFPDALVAVVEEEGRGLTHLLWPTSRAPVTRPMPVGNFGVFRFDVVGRWMASTTDVPDAEGALLSMGITSSFEPLVSGVTSLAWHDEDPGALAYTQVGNGAISLWVVHPDRRPSLVIEALPRLMTVQSWGSWGFALQDQASAQIHLYNESGEPRSTLPGVAHGSHPNGWIAASDGELMLVSAGGGVSRLRADPDTVGAILNAEFSPDRSRLAVRGDEGLLLVDVETGESRGFYEVPGDNADLAWSSDSRFVICPHFRGALLVDSETESMEAILGNQTVSAVSTISLLGS